MKVNIIGAGLAGVEAAWILAQNQIKVRLYEMRPKVMSPAHQTSLFAELVCSNSFRSNEVNTGVGLLKAEMRKFNSLVLQSANQFSLEAGTALAVSRTEFSEYITTQIKQHPNIEIINQEYQTIDLSEITIICAGPLASASLTQSIQALFDQKQLHFFDAVAPIIEKSSIDLSVCYLKNRYDKGEPAYINCPMNQSEYLHFYQELINAQKVTPKDFENNVFEGCMPVEVMAQRGVDTLLFGPLKPVGLSTPSVKPYAVVQLRCDDANQRMYNMVGFQTHLTFGEQKRIIQLIPGLAKANILRYGVMHRNTYLESPLILNQSYQTKKYPNLFFAGQITGVEGYIESAASGLVAGLNVLSLIKRQKLLALPRNTMMGAMAYYISTISKTFVPMNANFGLLEELDQHHRKKERKQAYAQRALSLMDEYIMEELSWM